MKHLFLFFSFLLISTLIVAQSNDSIYTFPSEYPTFAEGDSARVSFVNLRIENAGLKAEGIYKTLYAKLIIEKTGIISDAIILKGINPKIDNMVLAIIKSMPPWKPGKNEGEIVRCMSVFQVKVPFSDKPEVGTTFYDSQWKITTSKKSSFSRSIVKKDTLFLVEYFDNNYLRIESGQYLSLNPPIRHGRFVNYYTNGQILSDYFYENDSLEGECIDYYINGSIRVKANYHKNVKNGVYGEFLESGDPIVTREYTNGAITKDKLAYKVIDDKNNFYTKIEADTALVLPHFPNGKSAMTAFIDKNLKFPDAAKNKGISGESVIAFDIEVDGSITNIRVVKSLHPLLDEEAIRVVKLMPKWVPATKRGKPIKVKYTWYAGFKEQIH